MADSTDAAPAGFRLQGRLLQLVDDAALLRAQLGGTDLPWPPPAPLRDDISTDEITPAYICYHHDATLGDFPYLGLRAADGSFPLERGRVRAAGFAASVSGRRRGKGSSREAAPFAERAAGIRLVIAESLERIYRENCQNLGLLTSTDLSLVPRLLAGETIPLDVFLAGEGAITQAIIRAGGLMPYALARTRGTATVPALDTPPRPMTLAEKILARHWITATGTGTAAVAPGDEGFVRTDLRFSHEYVTPMAAALWAEHVGEDVLVTEPGSVLCFRDHLTFLDAAMTDERKAEGLLDVALELKAKQEAFCARHGVRLHGELPRAANGTLAAGSEAICHSLVLERYALPGQVIVGSDSHTPHAGALGALAFGIGTTQLCASWLTRDARVRVPPQVLVRVDGRCAPGVTAKDLMLELLRQPFVRDGHAIGTVIEYAGEAVEALSVDERATMTNMAAEVGAFTALVRPDARVTEFLAERRGMPRDAAEALVRGLASDPDAHYDHVLVLDAAAIRPLVALPGDPGNGRPIDELGEIPIDIAYAGSCTAGKRADVDMYAAVFVPAARAGRRIPAHVRCYIQFGSQDVRAYAEAQGYIAAFRAVGAEVIEPSCGACINAGPGVSYARDTVTVSAINRNFPGRSGPGQVYLGSPYTVAASALAGRIVGWGGGEG